MSKFEYQGITFHYETWGQGEPLIFLHGLGGSIVQPKGLFDEIPGIWFVSMDQRAHGRTAGNLQTNDQKSLHHMPKANTDQCSNLSFETLADDVIALADTLGIRKFNIGGISMGAGVSVNLAIRYPERVSKLILVRNAWLDGPMRDQIRRWYQQVAEYLRNGDKQGFIKTDIFKEITEIAPGTAETFLGLFHDPASLRYPEKYEIMPAQRPIKSMEELRNIHAHTLILSNKQDPIHEYSFGAYYQKYIPNAISYEITSKVVSKEQHRKDFNDYIREFILNI